MQQRIVTNLWFDTEAEEATGPYTGYEPAADYRDHCCQPAPRDTRPARRFRSTGEIA